ncbi:MFS transporter [Exiguobacterium undae]|uniref:MFS transporter n=1 Tax=Exiguobacterium undae TaxID=169177 RepID=A0ABX2VC23_9BACL|nr:MFS transporter [Exiguobacterium undae]OAN15493.1 hypothetical protein A3783_06040 [Exiguobacterium undae]
MDFIQEHNAKYLLAGRTASSLGDSLYQIAVIWYIYELTGNTIFTGAAVACISIPQVFNFLFGPLIDRADKRKILINSQLIQFLIMAIIPIAIILNVENVYLVFVVITLLAFVENFQGTAEMSIVPLIMEKKNIGPFNSFNNSLQEIISLIITGAFSLIILYVGIRDIYLFNAVTFLLACLFFTKIKYSSSKKNVVKNTFEKENSSEYRIDLKEGLSYFISSKLLIITLPFMFANGLISGIGAILPDFANFLGNSKYYGFLMFTVSIGLLLGSILSPLFMKFKIGTVFIFLPLATATIWITALLQPFLVLTFILLGLSMVPFGIMNIVFLTLNQNAVEERFLSRVLSISDSFLFIAIPIGAVAIGVIASHTSPLITMYLGAGSFIIIGFFYLLNPSLRNLPTIENLKLYSKE